MPRYWVIAPYDAREPDVWEAVWDYDYTNGVIAIGWEGLGDLSSLSEYEIRTKVVERWPGYTTGAATSVARMLYKFYHEIEIGDQLIVRRGVKRIAGLGTVTSKGYYCPAGLHEVFAQFPYDDGSVVEFPHQLKVNWDQEICSSEYEFDTPVFGMQTLYELPKQKFESLMELESDVEPLPSRDSTAECGAEFVLEKYLEEFVATNFEEIFKRSCTSWKHPKRGQLDGSFGQMLALLTSWRKMSPQMLSLSLN